MHLVVLDDNESVNEFMAAVARRRGWQVQTATHQAAFREIVNAALPDVIMLDLQLGESDGIEELRFLQSKNYPGVLVLMSGFDSRVLAAAQQIGESLGLNVAAMIEKPARAARVVEVLVSIEQHTSAAPANVVSAPDAIASISPHDLEEAIDAGHMELHLQPIVGAAGRQVQRAEALIRWRDARRGLVPPDAFIPVAESDAAVIDRLTMWVAEAGMAQYQRLADLGSPVQICINISGCNLRSLEFPDRMAALRDQMDMPPDAVGLEITESVAMNDLDVTTSVLARLRLKGFPVAIDDFGTGHSSLTALRRMPFSAIKIDKSFIAEMQTSSDSLTIVRSVIQLAHDMHLASVAEGVETADEVRVLTELGIDGLQGYYFSEPLPFDGFVAWLREWTQAAHA